MCAPLLIQHSGFETVAVKELHSEVLYVRELSAMKAVQGCKWSVQLLGWFEKDSKYYIIMEVTAHAHIHTYMLLCTLTFTTVVVNSLSDALQYAKMCSCGGSSGAACMR